MAMDMRTVFGVLLQLFCAVASFAADDGVVCRRYAGIPVALTAGGPVSDTVTGELCATKDAMVAGATIQLLIHGATYNHDYWDFGTVDHVGYSYARDVAARGFPTLAIDLPGAGLSSHPRSDLLTAQAEAFVAHQIVQALRDGSITGVQFGKVIIVGHSLGSVVVWLEAINYADVDGVIVTGAAHAVTAKFLSANALYPAVNDPKFASSGLDAGYLTTVPGTRTKLFFSLPDVDPAVIAADETAKDVVPGSELATGLPVVTSTATLAISVPVLTILGSNDFTTCGLSSAGVNFDCSSGAAVAAQEMPFYSPEARIHACIVPASGHDLSLAVNRGLQTEDAVAWSAAFVGQLDFGKERRASDSIEKQQGLAWNDGLPWNCGGVSGGSQ